MSSEVPDLSLFEHTNIALMTALTAFWFSCIGASLGSFLNVVVYRLPRRISLVSKGSACPNCQQPIEMRDNIPILGWAKLRGRCRNCQWPIPIRYPLVELAVAAQFVVLFFVELISGGANLPGRETEFYAGVLWTVWYLKYPDLMQIYLFHCLLLYLSIAFFLIAADRRLPPLGLVVFSVLAGFVWLAIEPRLLPVLGLPRWDGAEAWSYRLLALRCGLMGMIVGAGTGMIMGLAHADNEDTSVQSALCVIFAICGLYLGPSATLSVAAINLILYFAGQSIAYFAGALKHLTLVPCTVLALHIQILFWRQLSAIPYWPSHSQTWSHHLQVLAVVVAIVVAIRDRNPQQPSTQPRCPDPGQDARAEAQNP